MQKVEIDEKCFPLPVRIDQIAQQSRDWQAKNPLSVSFPEDSKVVIKNECLKVEAELPDAFAVGKYILNVKPPLAEPNATLLQVTSRNGKWIEVQQFQMYGDAPVGDKFTICPESFQNTIWHTTTTKTSAERYSR